jgi:hypothetical protein
MNLFYKTLAVITLTLYASGENKNIYIIREKPVVLYADINGDNEKEKIIIKQNWVTSNDSRVKSNITINIYELEKLAFSYNEIYDPILYVYVVNFMGGAKEFTRDVVFVITESNFLKMNILYWERNISEHDIKENALSNGKIKFKGKYKFFKTNIQINTPYG